jgi:hypothetical protein
MLKPPQMPPRHDNTNNNNTNDVIQQLATAQAQLMQMMTQFIQASANNNNNNPPPPPPPPPPAQVDRLAQFLRLRPNKFSSATDPILADDWLRFVSKDLMTCECTNAENVRFTAHLLEGPAAMWWETYQVTHPVEGLDWVTFREGFRNAHISSGIMNLKKDEFCTLRQGKRTLKEYMDDFFSLSRYAPDDVDTDAKRKDKFLAGLKGELKIPLSVAYAPSSTVGTMDTTMEEMDSAILTQMPRRISHTSHASSVKRLGTTPPLAQRTSQMMLPSPIHSIRDR